MFDIGALELFVIVIVAVVVIGPKDMPLAMRTAGRWIGKVRRVSAHFRTGVDAMVREAELEDMEKEWKARNEEIMRKSAPSSSDADSVADMKATTMTGPAMTGPPPVETTPTNSESPAGPTPAKIEPAKVQSPTAQAASEQTSPPAAASAPGFDDKP